MSNEKIMILKMLEEGKITADEAERLLGTVGKESAHTGSGASTSYSRQNTNNSAGTGGASTGGSAFTGFDEFTNDLGRKFETFARDMEPKLQKFTEVVAEKTVNVADKISKSFASETVSRPVPTGSFGPGMEKNIEMIVQPGYNELSLSTANGDMLIKGYNGDKITAKLFYKPRRAGAAIDMIKLGGKYYLNYNEDDFEKVSVDMFVPEAMFQVVNLSNINGRLDVSSIKTDHFVAANANGSTRVASLVCDSIKMDCSNGMLDISGIRGGNAQIENFNGSIEANDIDVSALKLIGGNGGINVSVAYLRTYSEYVWAVEASNGRLNMNLPTLPELGYHIKAHTTLGTVKIGLTNMNYISNSHSFTEARSIHFDSAAKKVKLSLETSNGPLVVN